MADALKKEDTVEVRIFVSPDRGKAPLKVKFGALMAGETPIVKWRWEFGDGTGCTGHPGDEPCSTSPEHEYKEPGKYLAKVTAWDENSSGSDSWPINVS